MAEPVVVELESRPFAYISLRSSLEAMPATMGQGFASLAQMFAKAKAQMAGNPLAHYTAFDAASASFDLGFPARAEDVPALRSAGLSIGETPSGQNMTATHVGPYDTVSKTYDVMSAAMKARGLSGARDMWESYLSPPDTPPGEIRTDVIWHVEPVK
jgi:effector-binding domain-containing protein